MIHGIRIKVHKTAIDIKFIINDGGLMPKSPAKAVIGIFGSTNPLGYEGKQHYKECLFSVSHRYLKIGNALCLRLNHRLIAELVTTRRGHRILGEENMQTPAGENMRAQDGAQASLAYRRSIVTTAELCWLQKQVDIKSDRHICFIGEDMSLIGCDWVNRQPHHSREVQNPSAARTQRTDRR